MTSSISRRDRALVIFFVTIQIVVPTALLITRWVNEGSHPTSEYKFSWQMYSAASGGEYVGINGSGDEIPLKTSHLPIVIRGIGYGDTVPRILCKEDPTLMTVGRRMQGDALEQFTEPVIC